MRRRIGKNNKQEPEKLFVAVGNYGLIATSTDGMRWDLRSSPVRDDLKDITYGNGLFVAVGNSGAVITSRDGIYWTNTTSEGIRGLTAVTYGNGLFVAGGYDSHVFLTSPDGYNWTIRESDGFYFSGLTFGNNRYVGLTFHGNTSPSNGVMISYDGIHWSRCDTPTSYGLWGATYGKGLFVAVGNYNTLITSPNGTDWTNRLLMKSYDLTDVTYGNGSYVAVGGTNWYSSDGVTWTKNVNGPGIMSGITYANKLFVAVGNSGNISTSPNGTDKTWTTTSIGASLNKVTAGEIL